MLYMQTPAGRRRLLAASSALGAFAALNASGMAAAPEPVAMAPVGTDPLPRRHLLTKTMGSGIAHRNGLAKISGGLPLTFLYVVPIEAPCLAVRLGFGNCFNTATVIDSASVWTSTTYSQCAAMQARHRTSNTMDLRPTGGGAPSKVYFDNEGRDDVAITTRGVRRSFVVPAIQSNFANVPRSFVIQWSDFVQCSSTPRTDGGTQHILFIYVTVSSDSISSDTSRFRAGNLDPHALRGRLIYRGVASTGGIDRADNPTGTGWKDAGDIFGPLFCLQYVTASPGIQLVLNGDSLSAAPIEDGYSTPLHRAAWDLSTPAVPIEVASTAWSGTRWSVYGRLLMENIASLSPSVVAYQPLSRNDGAGTAILRALLAQTLLVAERSRTLYGARAICNSAGCEPSWSGKPKAIEGFIDMRTRLAALARNGGIPVIDGPAVLGQYNAPWDYLPGVSNDNTHPNFAGAELVVPLARAALLDILGLG